ncbi:sulfatase [Candidatus Hydrogenedentota bacterium]
MNVIVFVCDTFRYDHMGCNGNDWIRTPCIDKLAAESVVFDNAQTGSFATLPNRMDCFNGRYNFLYRGWTALSPEQTLAETLTEAGYTTQLICDTPHMINNGRNFGRGFQGWRMIRGQEVDPFMTAANVIVEDACPDHIVNRWGKVPQYYRNSLLRKTETDWASPRTMMAATEWLEMNYKAKDFFLWVDCFDPHEPWDPPEWFTRHYYPDYKGIEYVYPKAGKASVYSKSELKWFRARYAGKVTLVDKWIGFALRKLEDLGLDKTTMILLTSDHGTYLGDHNRIVKACGGKEMWSLLNEVGHIPLMVRPPAGVKQKRVSKLVQPFDLMPTVLDMCGVKAPAGVQGKSYAHMLEGSRKSIHKYAVSSGGMYDEDHINKRMPTITGNGFALCLASTGKHELYDMKKDPLQTRNVFKKHPEIARKMFKWLEDMFAGEGLDPGRIAVLKP